MRFYTKNHAHYCGIDLHAKTMYLCILDKDGQILLHENMRSRPEAFLAAVEPFREDLAVAVECMFTWYWLADLCRREGIEFVLGHALYMKAIHGAKAKNDKVDAARNGLNVRAPPDQNLTRPGERPATTRLETPTRPAPAGGALARCETPGPGRTPRAANRRVPPSTKMTAAPGDDHGATHPAKRLARLGPGLNTHGLSGRTENAAERRSEATCSSIPEPRGRVAQLADADAPELETRSRDCDPRISAAETTHARRHNGSALTGVE